MPTLMVTHAVRDYDVWKQMFDSDPLGREASGVRGHRVMRASDDPNDDPRFVTYGMEQIGALERRIRRPVHTRRGMTHLADPLPEAIGVLRVQPLVESERALHFPLWRRRNVRDGGEHQSTLDPVKPQEATHVLIDREADARSAGVRRDPRELRNTQRRDSRHRVSPE